VDGIEYNGVKNAKSVIIIVFMRRERMKEKLMTDKETQEGYKETDEIKALTPQIILQWKKFVKNSPQIFLVRRKVSYYCPIDKKEKTQNECHNCSHHFGDASPREIYCIPSMKQEISIRTKKKKEKIKTEEKEKKSKRKKK
jgi:hypothetical protein